MVLPIPVVSIFLAQFPVPDHGIIAAELGERWYSQLLSQFVSQSLLPVWTCDLQALKTQQSDAGSESMTVICPTLSKLLNLHASQYPYL